MNSKITGRVQQASGYPESIGGTLTGDATQRGLESVYNQSAQVG